MTVDYTIAAIPTMYRNRQYRSRLEARWASFFDRIRWAHEYEPVDLGKWSPDFIIYYNHSRSFNGKTPRLVEVKPLLYFDAAIARKMVKAAGGGHDMLLTRISPKMIGQDMSIGWKWEASCQKWTDALLGWGLCAAYPIIASPNESKAIFSWPTVGSRFWSEASNAVQWQGPGK